MSSRQSGASLQDHPSHWPPDPIPPVGYLSRKALPIKKNDAEPLTRKDVQYDMLEYIFTDQHAVFTSPVPGKMDKVTFSDLYVSALYNSNKCSKVLKDKMKDTPAFAIELAKLSLLTNVGRINTTMAFFPEMKTALRTYHPVPSLQKTDGNAQDAPRIKNCLKASLLPSESKGVPPSNPDDILGKSRSGHRPPTSVINLIFVLANHAAPLSDIHFEGGFNFLDLFLPGRGLASDDRGRCFLWMMFHYLENHENNNPFDDEYSRTHSRKAPRLRPLTHEDLARENVDTPEEIEWGRKMSVQRNIFLKNLVASLEREKRGQLQPSEAGPSSTSLTKTYSAPVRATVDLGTSSTHHNIVVPSMEKNLISHMSETGERRRQLHPEIDSIRRQDAYREADRRQGRPHLLPHSQVPRAQLPGIYPRQDPVSNAPRERSMIEQAWFEVCNTDPLADSEEEFQDEYARRDYMRRREILRRYTRLEQIQDSD